MQEQETMWTRFAQDAAAQELVLPAVAAENDRKYIIKRKVTNFEVRYLFCVHINVKFYFYSEIVSSTTGASEAGSSLITSVVTTSSAAVSSAGSSYLAPQLIQKT